MYRIDIDKTGLKNNITGDISCIYGTADVFDHIHRLYGQEENNEECVCFSPVYKNIQNHAFYLSHSVLFHTEKSAWIEFSFYGENGELLEEDILNNLADAEKAEVSYYSTQGFIPFERVWVKNGILYVYKGEKQPEAVTYLQKDTESYRIRFQIKDIECWEEFDVTDIECSCRSVGIEPDYIIREDRECNPNQYLPFGEQPVKDRAVYFASQEALDKKGAEVELSFGMHFIKVPTAMTSSDTFQWSWVMNEKSFQMNVESDITIEHVIWEYYNGKGWTRLHKDNSFAEVFDTKKGTSERYETIRFICPSDMQKVLVRAQNVYCIRARVAGVRNMNKKEGYYVLPVLENTTFHYSYTNYRQKPEWIMAENNGTCMKWKGDRKHHEKLTLLQKLPIGGYPSWKEKEGIRSIYIGFNKKPGTKPYLWTIENEDDRAQVQLAWEYWTESGWKWMDYEDTTGHLSHTGTIMLKSRKNMARKVLFGQECYWVRITDYNAVYHENCFLTMPRLKGIYKTGEYTWEEDKETQLPSSARVITATDFELAVKALSEEIVQVECFSGMDRQGNPSAKDVTLVVQQKNARENRCAFGVIKEKIYASIKDRTADSLTAEGHFFIIEPQYVKMCVKVKLDIADLSKAYIWEKKVQDCLDAYFELDNGCKKWTFGDIPTLERITYAIQEGVDRKTEAGALVPVVRSVLVSTYVEDRYGWKEIDPELCRRMPYALPYNGEHEVKIALSENSISVSGSSGDTVVKDVTAELSHWKEWAAYMLQQTDVIVTEEDYIAADDTKRQSCVLGSHYAIPALENVKLEVKADIEVNDCDETTEQQIVDAICSYLKMYEGQTGICIRKAGLYHYLSELSCVSEIVTIHLTADGCGVRKDEEGNIRLSANAVMNVTHIYGTMTLKAEAGFAEYVQKIDYTVEENIRDRINKLSEQAAMVCAEDMQTLMPDKFAEYIREQYKVSPEEAVSYYRKRGTKQGMEDFIQWYTGYPVQVEEDRNTGMLCIKVKKNDTMSVREYRTLEKAVRCIKPAWVQAQIEIQE